MAARFSCQAKGMKYVINNEIVYQEESTILSKKLSSTLSSFYILGRERNKEDPLFWVGLSSAQRSSDQSLCSKNYVNVIHFSLICKQRKIHYVHIVFPATLLQLNSFLLYSHLSQFFIHSLHSSKTGNVIGSLSVCMICATSLRSLRGARD